MRLYLIRHAHAGSRSRWEGDDRLRPLSERGVVQAAAIARALAGAPITAVRSSPSVRCLQTIGPLARQQGCAIESDDRLFEGAAVTEALAVVDELAGVEAALCSHGDVIPELIDFLRRCGVTVDGAGCEKGSVWQLDRDGSTVVRATYLGRPAVIS